ncbi:MAG: ADP compounds hydrolase NudE [Xanthomonadales bacterium]|nr:ADP compounds hydrolase NudE [Xanthomonadales bacterium]HQW65090.1 ADP compounds hydrolase NudE [Pseudomonadota bacterium]MBP6692795.1 ADP compounds hydrolase NudE [Xanthomonadales bacterium]MBP7419334.1 ADP compounds hydrolase NudE [Xanthomonadales bacterium]MBP8177467.1 ADP compounds hydrolase NudE [Xanthomonadales bacterium]
MSKLPVIHATRLLGEGSRFPVEQIDLEFSNGVKRTFERMPGSGRGAVVVVPMRDEHTVLLVREYAAGLHTYELGLPKGRLERGEDLLEGANRELKEEVGYGARRLRIVGKLSLAPTYMSHQTHVILAQDLYPERLMGDEPEELEVVPWRLDELHTLVQRDDCTEGRSIAALFMTRELLRSGVL